MPTELVLILAAAGLLGLAALAGGPRRATARAAEAWSAARAAEACGRRPPPPPGDAARLTLGLRGWRTWCDGLSKSYQCDSQRDAQEFVCELAHAIDSVDELSRLRSRIRGRVVRIHIRAPVVGGSARRVRSDAHFALRLDGLGRPSFCAPLFGPADRF
jgi:hypothetical protein